MAINDPKSFMDTPQFIDQKNASTEVGLNDPRTEKFRWG